MGVARLVLKVAVALLLLGVAAFGVAYAMDMKVEATVVETDCVQAASTVTVQAKLLGIRHTADLDRSTCLLLSKENFVEYRIRSGRTSLYEVEGGRCIYDTQHGLGGCSA